MILAILDTNVLIQATISSRGASFRTVQAGLKREYRFAFSPATLDELQAVLTLPRIRSRNAWSDDQVGDYIRVLASDALLGRGDKTVSESIARDMTDTKFLRLALETSVDYLVTNDRRHLLRLREFGSTKIVTPAQFLIAIASNI